MNLVAPHNARLAPLGHSRWRSWCSIWFCGIFASLVPWLAASDSSGAGRVEDEIDAAPKDPRMLTAWLDA
jgi:hypothetical protein